MAMHLEVVTPKGKLLEAEVSEVTAPGSSGQFGVLPGHVPLLSGLRPGVLSYKGAGGGAIAVGKGFAEVDRDRVIVLVDQGEKVDQIDVAAAHKELAAAQQELAALPGDDLGARATAEERRDWAQARIDAAGGKGATAPVS
jgi:F-type H+-transporting ATPase subunit epsilon